MASTVLSGTSNPSYRNNTGQNVRVVINYMAGTPLQPFVPAVVPGIRGRGPTDAVPEIPFAPSRLTINWAGVSVTNSSNIETIVIGRNLAFANSYSETAEGGLKTVSIGGLNEGIAAASQFKIIGFTQVSTDVAVSAALAGNNAKGIGVALPTELMLAPNETFSAVSGVYNIVIIPENG